MADKTGDKTVSLVLHTLQRVLDRSAPLHAPKFPPSTIS